MNSDISSRRNQLLPAQHLNQAVCSAKQLINTYLLKNEQ